MFGRISAELLRIRSDLAGSVARSIQIRPDPDHFGQIWPDSGHFGQILPASEHGRISANFGWNLVCPGFRRSIIAEFQQSNIKRMYKDEKVEFRKTIYGF
jgi:hypothetical protein